MTNETKSKNIKEPSNNVNITDNKTAIIVIKWLKWIVKIKTK